jgi:hypothetical protein
MKFTDLDTARSQDLTKSTMDDIIGDLFHDAQNGVHLVGMELELVSMGLGNTADAVKTAEIVKLLENNLRDLRGYISSVQEPSATCDPAAVLDYVISNLQSRNRDVDLKLKSLIPDTLPLVLTHRKLLTRVLERVFDFCENLLPQGGELSILAASQCIESQFHAEISLTMTGIQAIPMVAEQEFRGSRSSADRGQANQGIQRALEVLRRQRGQITFRRHSEHQCQLTLRMLAAPL